MRTGKLSVNEIKIKNRQMIYQHIRAHGPVSKQDIVVALQLSLPTVTQNLEYLKEHGLIDDSQQIKNTGGRNATAYTYIKDAKQAMGVYISAHHMNVVALDLAGGVLGQMRRRVKFNLDDDAYLKEMGEAVEKVKEEAGITDEGLLGVGISVPGLVSGDGSRVVYGKTLDFTGKTKEEIAKYIPYKIRLFHDSHAAGRIVAWHDDKVQVAFYISLSNSIGGAIIMNNKLFGGVEYKGGELRHMTIVPEGGEKCYCGKYGCLDTVCKTEKLDWYTDGNLEEYFQKLKDGDDTAVKLWDEYLENLSTAIHNMRMIFAVDVILGGYVGKYIGDYMDELRKRVDAKNPFGDKAEDYLYMSEYEGEECSAGAAIFFVEEFMDGI